ncbi:hypothetical protein PsB1_1712 [Candidatus Phycosocius spiralis]|uniref:Transposase n=1 Tax=Candidatus Phycosocius spiralis TaxID=2815099 RepID=A0ABQ4PX16_9PROT|nr:hypothetical protein PsB1_1712 [Candidatus Phycosocius spiralis]
MCKVLRIAPSTWYARKAQKADPRKRSNRAKADDAMSLKIRQVFEDNFGVYGVRMSGTNSGVKAKMLGVTLWLAL